MTFRAARDLLLAHREDYDARATASSAGRSSTTSTGRSTGSTCSPREQPRPPGAVDRRGGRRARRGCTFAELSRALEPGRQLAARARACARGDRLLLMLGNRSPLWETMLAAMKLGAVVIPATHAARPGRPAPTASSAARCATWSSRAADARQVRRRARRLHADRGRRAAPTAGCATTTRTTRRDRLHARRRRPGPTTRCCSTSPPAPPPSPSWSSTPTRRYPVGHLSTMYWIGLQPGDVHLNISSPGWAKHAWSNVFAPWNAGRDRARLQLRALRRAGAAGRAGRARRHHVLRAADGVADADPGRTWRRWPVAAARGRRRRASRSTPR